MVLLALACTHEPTRPADGLIPRGVWGAANAGLIVDGTDAHVHIGCTNGYFPATVVLDAHARFNVAGSYRLRVYPVAVGPSLPAEFSGSLAGDRLTLRVVVNDTVEHRTVTLGPVTVTLGKEPRMGPCPICRTDAGDAGTHAVRAASPEAGVSGHSFR